MKKLISLLLALVMVMGLATTAFAAETETTLNKDNGYAYDIPVTGEYINELKSDEIISVDVEWGSMDFTYAATQQGTWNPKTHAYDNATEEAAWVNDTTSDITVTNHSNVDVTASFKFDAETSYSTVTGSFTQNSVDLDAGVVNKKDEADKETVTFTIGGTLDTSAKGGAKLGTITVSVNKKAGNNSGNVDGGERTVTGIRPYSSTDDDRAAVIYYYFDRPNKTPDWSDVTFYVTYSDGSSENITGNADGVTITTGGTNLEDITSETAASLGNKVTCTITYKTYSAEFDVSLYSTQWLPGSTGYSLN